MSAATRRPSRLRAEALEDRATPATFTVTNPLDDGQPGNLRAAVDQANATAEPDTIEFAPGLAGATIGLSELANSFRGPSYLRVDTPITIRGTGQTIAPAAGADPGRLFAVFGPLDDFNGDLTLRDLTLTGGRAVGASDTNYIDGRGGAILNSFGTVRVFGCTLTGNEAVGAGGFGPNNATPPGDGQGGAVANVRGTLLMANSTVTGNTARGGAASALNGPGGGFGGGLYNQNGTATLTNATVADNTVAGGQGSPPGPDSQAGPPGPAAGSAVYNHALDIENQPAEVRVGNSILAADGEVDVVTNRQVETTTATITATGPNIVTEDVVNDGGTVAGGMLFEVVDPVLGPLQDNGGPTRTMAPNDDGPAFEAGDDALLTAANFGGAAPATDQRGAGFPRVAFGAVDLGAVEAQPAGPVLTLTPPTLPGGQVGTLYGQTVTFLFNSEEVTATFAVTAGALPPGLALVGAGEDGDGRVQVAGTPTAAGTYTFTLTGGGEGTASREYTIVVAPIPTLTLTPETLPGGQVGTGYAQTITTDAVGGGYSDVSFAVTAGALPPGLAVGNVDDANGEPTAGALTGTPTAAGTYTFTLTATDALQGTAGSREYTVVVAPAEAPPSPIPQPIAVGGSLTARATVYTPTLPTGKYDAAPAVTADLFGAGANVRTAIGDVDGDGYGDAVMVTGPGVPTRFAVVSGKDHTTVLIPPRAPFEGSEGFTGGGLVTAADLDGDGRAEVVLTPDFLGGPRVVAFALRAGGAVDRVANFLGIEDAAFRGGCRAALGDVNGDGTPDLAVTAGFPGGPRAAVWDGKTLLGAPARLVNDFFAFGGADVGTLRHGAFVAAGDVDGDRFADLIFGGGPGGAPRVFVLSGKMVAAGDVIGAQAAPVANFYVAGNSSDRLGVRVGATDADQDGRADVVAGTGERTAAGVRVYLGKDVTPGGEPAAFQDLDPFARSVLANGVFVG